MEEFLQSLHCMKPYRPAKPLAAQSSNAQPTPHASGEVRIIGGQWKRTVLPVAARPGLRPTPSRVRETLFNWLGHDLGGLRCVDAFAGTGALGFEAASRGAGDVVLLESDAHLVVQLGKIKGKLNASTVRIQRGDGIAFLQNQPLASIDIIFIDPPFDAPIFEKALMAAKLAVSARGAIYLEAPKAWSPEALAPLGLALQRAGKAGAVHYHLLGVL